MAAAEMTWHQRLKAAPDWHIDQLSV